MIVYNITTNVSWTIHDKWLLWLKEEYIPEMLATNCFYESRVLRLLDVDEDEGPTYAIQLHAFSTEDYQKFVAQHAAFIHRHATEKWGNEIIAFSSAMEVLH